MMSSSSAVYFPDLSGPVGCRTHPSMRDPRAACEFGGTPAALDAVTVGNAAAPTDGPLLVGGATGEGAFCAGEGGGFPAGVGPPALPLTTTVVLGTTTVVDPLPCPPCPGGPGCTTDFPLCIEGTGT